MAQNPSKPEPDEMTEIGVMSMQLVMDKEAWKIFNRHKGRAVRLMCVPFHATNGHHFTPVLCEVKTIDAL